MDGEQTACACTVSDNNHPNKPHSRQIAAQWVGIGIGIIGLGGGDVATIAESGKKFQHLYGRLRGAIGQAVLWYISWVPSPRSTMSLQATLDQIIQLLRRGRFTSEADVSQGIVLQVLRDLEWDTGNIEIVIPEYTAGRGRVDFALCPAPGKKPVIFIEVKKPALDEGAEQLLEYAFKHGGVPMAVLTNGQVSRFYLPGELGDFQERQFYNLDLLQRSVDEAVEVFSRFLHRDRVVSGAALEQAKKELAGKTKNKTIMHTLPQAWHALLEEPDGLLCDLLIDKTESLCGYAPTPQAVADFLQQQHQSPQIPPAPAVTLRAAENSSPYEPVKIPSSKTKIIGYELDGSRHTNLIGSTTIMAIFDEFQRRDDTFLPRLQARTSQKRPLVSPNKNTFSGRVRPKRLTNGWWIDTHYNSASKEKFVKIACEIMGVAYQQNLKLIHTSPQIPPIPAVAPQAAKNSHFDEQVKIPSSKSGRSKIVGYELDGKFENSGSGAATMVAIFNRFYDLDHTFLTRLQPKTASKKRKLVSPDKRNLFTKRSDLAAKRTRKLKMGWWVNTNYGSIRIESFLKIACEIMGKTYGRDLKLIWK